MTELKKGALRKMGIASICMITAFLFGMSGACFANSMELLKDGKTERVYRVTVNPSVEPFEVHQIYDNPDSMAVTEMKVYRGDELLQTLPVKMEEEPYIESEYLDTMDINMDGFIDISVLVWWRPNGNEGRSYWLYNPQTDRFEYNEQLADIEAIGFDEQNRIVSYSKGGRGGCVYSYRAYEWEGTKLVLVFEAGQDYDEKENKYHKVITERRDGKMVVVSDKMLTADEAILEREEGSQLKY